MLSLDNALDEADMREFDRRVRELLQGAEYQYVAELKMDGLSLAAQYRDGQFVAGAHARRRSDRRRGDGECAHHSFHASAREDNAAGFRSAR